MLSDVAQRWLEPDYPFRRLALEQGPAATGFSAPTLAAGLDCFFKQLTRENFHALMEQDLGHAQRLDRMVSAEVEHKSGRGAMAVAPELLVHFAAGNLPAPALMSIALGVLVRSAQFVKCASGATLLPRLGACIEIAGWPGGNQALSDALFAEADCVTATGSDSTLESIRLRLPGTVRFLGYGHRVSFAFVASRALSGLASRRIVERAAADVAAWNQVGCLSPHLIYVEEGGDLSAEQFAEALAKEMERREAAEPRGELPVESAAAIAYSPDTRCWFSGNSTAWTVVYEADPRFQLSCLNRFVYVKGVRDLTQALQSADSVRGRVSTVGLAAPDDQAQQMAAELARWGVSRVCPVGRMQNPPLTWRHDGRPALGDLVGWTDWELE